jgi:GNAT superfamily N-acetyltransferase
MTRTTRPAPITVELLDPAAAADRPLVEELCHLVNAVYAVAEEGMWRAGTDRTSPDEIARSIAAGEVLVATVARRGIVGAVRVHDVEPEVGEFGPLVSAPDRRNVGVGRVLLDEVERRAVERGQHAMQLELLVPREWRHPSKELLASWYGRRGYRHVSTTSVEQSHPHLAPLLATPCELQIHRKALTPPHGAGSAPSA